MSDREARYSRNPDFIFRKIVEELVLVPIHQDVASMECIYALNEVGAFVWGCLENPATRAELQLALREEYDVEAEVLTTDLERFLGEMVEIGAVQTG